MRIPIRGRVVSRLATFAVALALAAGTAGAQELSGPDVWASNCGTCHRLRGLDSYGSAQWNSIVTHMALVARLTPAETRAVREFIVSSARTREQAAERSRLGLPRTVARTGDEAAFRPVATGTVTLQREGADARSIYRSKCAACHGSQGRGDGPAASALNPRPTDFWDLSHRQATSDSAVADVIESGRRGMPAFGSQLSHEDVELLVGYLRTFRR